MPTRCSVLLVGDLVKDSIVDLVRRMTIALFKRPYFVLQLSENWTKEIVSMTDGEAEKTYLVTTNPSSKVLGIR